MKNRHHHTCLDFWGDGSSSQCTCEVARVQAALAALSEAVTQAREQLPEPVAQAWVDAERLVWRELGAI